MLAGAAFPAAFLTREYHLSTTTAPARLISYPQLAALSFSSSSLYLYPSSTRSTSSSLSLATLADEQQLSVFLERAMKA
jgi:hypothetical protein